MSRHSREDDLHPTISVSKSAIESMAEILLTPKSVNPTATPPPIHPPPATKRCFSMPQNSRCRRHGFFSLSQVCVVSTESLIMTLNITSLAIEDKILLTAALIDAILLAVLLLIQLRSCPPAIASYALALIVFGILLFLFLQDQVLLDTIEPAIEEFRKEAQSNDTG
jgi:hypothetical protein